MVGNKLIQLVQELNISQRKSLIHQCTISSDKRLFILKDLLSADLKDVKDLNQFLVAKVNEYWESAASSEKDTKARRLASYFVEQIEEVLLLTYLRKKTSIRGILLAQQTRKNGNIHLLSHYYDKSLALGEAEEDLQMQLISLKGKIRMKYASQNEKELLNALSLNEDLLAIIDKIQEEKITEYYFNISNVYLEKNGVINLSKDKIQSEILGYIAEFQSELDKGSLFLSLAKLNYDNDDLLMYLDRAKQILDQTTERTLAYFDLDRKVRFIELRLHFFAGADIKFLRKISEYTAEHFKAFSVINNNTLFYQLLFLILDDEIELAEKILKENHVFFHGVAGLLEMYLKAMIHDRKGEVKEVNQLLQKLMYSSNYFISAFSRLHYIRIQIQRGKPGMALPVIESTSRYFTQNKGNALGALANKAVLKSLKSEALGKGKVKVAPTCPLSVLHRYLLEA